MSRIAKTIKCIIWALRKTLARTHQLDSNRWWTAIWWARKRTRLARQTLKTLSLVEVIKWYRRRKYFNSSSKSSIRTRSSYVSNSSISKHKTRHWTQTIVSSIYQSKAISLLHQSSRSSKQWSSDPRTEDTITQIQINRLMTIALSIKVQWFLNSKEIGVWLNHMATVRITWVNSILVSIHSSRCPYRAPKISKCIHRKITCFNKVQNRWKTSLVGLKIRWYRCD